ncbi:hypothetical protein AYO49_06435 [Verrucomicrobiaceae bacterium SCGC AG-212-N21]|nr:hypothetical protein AYO49_06435 [Verrucomicrobiaceae bacterium SCGC AG-212-N21]
MVEVILVVTVLGLLAAVAVPSFRGTTSATAEVKLRSDIAHLNRAVGVYTAEGGRLEGADSAEQVLEHLKSKLGSADARRHVGPVSGRLIDPRLAMRPVSDATAKAGAPRAVWDPVLQRFEITHEGSGIGSFFLDDAQAGLATPEENRQRTAMRYNGGDGWIWEWDDQRGQGAVEPTEFALTPSDPLTPPGGGPLPDPPTDPTGGFHPTPKPLPAPMILPEGGVFSIAQFPTTILITDSGTDARYSALQYRLSDGPWKPYTSGFQIAPGTRVYAKNVSLDPARFTDSAEDTEAYYLHVPLITGTVTPQWANMTGKDNLEQTISNANPADIRATYGIPTESDGSPNGLGFKRTSFISVPPDTDFTVGQIRYYNGTVESGTEASGIDLKLNLQTILPIAQGGSASVKLSLWSSTNTNDPKASADYALLENPRTDFSIRVDGVTYTLKLRFANIKVEEGWTDGTRLHVYEDSWGNADLIGRFESSY